MTTDVELINKVKNENNSSALNELIERHSGMYVKIVQKYANIEKNSRPSAEKLDINELKDDKVYNIYKYILSYNPDKNTKFSTYVGQMTRYMCLDILNDTPDKIELTEINSPAIPENITEQTNKDNFIEEIKKKAKDVKEPLFWPILEMRHFQNKTHTWREIGKKYNITHEWARQIYNKNIKYIKQYVST